jgi:membrane protease YdiL (CAAX protease family)
MLLVAASTVRSGLLLREWTPPFNLLLSWPDNLLRLGLIIVCLVLGLSIGPGSSALHLATGGILGDLLLGLAAGAILTLLLGLGGSLATRWWGRSIYSNRVLECIMPIDGSEWAGVLPALFLAALLEEVLFRWLPLAGLAAPVSPWWLIWPLAIFFGLLHWPQGWWGVIGTGLAGIVLSMLFLLTGSIWPPLFAHYTMNVAQLVLARLTGVRPARGS